MRYLSIILLLTCLRFGSAAQVTNINTSPYQLRIEPVNSDSFTNSMSSKGFRFSGILYEEMQFYFVLQDTKPELPEEYYFCILEIYPDGNVHMLMPDPEVWQSPEDYKLRKGTELKIGPIIYTAPYGNYKTIVLFTPKAEIVQLMMGTYSSEVRRGSISLPKERVRDELNRVLKGIPSVLFRDAFFSTVDYVLLPRPAATGYQQLSRPSDIWDAAVHPGPLLVPFVGEELAPPMDSSCANRMYTEPGLLFSRYPMLTFINPAPDVDDFKRGAHVGKISSNTKYVIQGNVSAANGVKEVRINGDPAVLKKLNPVQFFWEKEVTLKPGTNQFSVTAVSEEGSDNCDRIELQYQPENRSVNTPGKNYLLLIGINQYQNWPVLTGAVNDLKEIHRLLLDFNFQEENIVELIDARATQDAIDSVFSLLQAKLGPNDNLLIYYAGHGIIDRQLEGRGYWVPVGARKEKRNDLIANDYLKDFIQSFRARHVMVFADACFSGSLIRGSRGEAAYTDRVEQLNSRFVFCSGREEVVDDILPGKKNSPFAYYLIQALKLVQPGQKLSIRELAMNVSRNVAAAVKQTPISGPLREAGDEGGEFSFIRKK